MTPRNTRTGGVLEAMVLPALTQGGYSYGVQVNIGKRLGLGRHFVDVIAAKDDERFLVSMKWQQVSGTAEQKVSRLDWKIWQTRDFKRDPNDPDKLTRYQAEALVHQHVPVSALQGIVCHRAEEETPLREMVHNSGQDLAVHSRPGWYA